MPASPWLFAGTATAQTPTTLRIGNWLPGHHLIPRGIIEPWARAIERESNGTLKLDLMPSAVGRPPEYFDFVVNGVVDIGYGVSGHNPGRFTMTQVMDLPFMSTDPWAGAAAAWLTYERYGARYNEHRGAKVLGLWVHSEPMIFMRAAPFTTLDDLKGKKIRVGGNVTGRIIQALGGAPIQLPPTEAQQAMASGVADGITFPQESIEFFKITPVIKGATRIPGGLYTDTFWLAINEAKWAALSAETEARLREAFRPRRGTALGLGLDQRRQCRAARRSKERRAVRRSRRCRCRQGARGVEGRSRRNGWRRRRSEPAGRRDPRLCARHGRAVPRGQAREHSVRPSQALRATVCAARDGPPRGTRVEASAR